MNKSTFRTIAAFALILAVSLVSMALVQPASADANRLNPLVGNWYGQEVIEFRGEVVYQDAVVLNIESDMSYSADSRTLSEGKLPYGKVQWVNRDTLSFTPAKGDAVLFRVVKSNRDALYLRAITNARDEVITFNLQRK